MVTAALFLFNKIQWGDFMGYVLTCDDGEFYFDDIDQAIEYGEQNCPRGYNVDEVYD